MNFTRRHFLSMITSIGVFAIAGPAVAKKHEHHSRKELLGEKVKANGKHVIDKHGLHTVSVEVVNGKVAGMNVKHDKKGNVPVKKYKTTMKMAETDHLRFVSYPGTLAQAQSLGTVYIGY